MTLLEAADLLEREAKRTREAAHGAVSDAANELRGLAVGRSSGPYSSGDLATLGHPYSRRHSSPLLPPEIINVQTGDFRRGWRVAKLGYSASVFNEDPKGTYLELGDEKMIARPIWDGIEETAVDLLADAFDRRITQ